MTIEIVDIEKLRKMNMADEFIGCFMDHVLRENGWDALGKKEESRKSTTRQEGDSPNTGSFPPSAQGGKGRVEGL